MNEYSQVSYYRYMQGVSAFYFCSMKYTRSLIWSYLDMHMYNKYMMYSYVVKHGFEKINDQVSDVSDSMSYAFP